MITFANTAIIKISNLGDKSNSKRVLSKLKQHVTRIYQNTILPRQLVQNAAQITNFVQYPTNCLFFAWLTYC